MAEVNRRRMQWKKPNACGTGTCVEVAIANFVWIRNSTDPVRSAHFTKAEWSAFTDAVKAGEFDV